jgi:hypothetical protein
MGSTDAAHYPDRPRVAVGAVVFKADRFGFKG